MSDVAIIIDASNQEEVEELLAEAGVMILGIETTGGGCVMAAETFQYGHWCTTCGWFETDIELEAHCTGCGHPADAHWPAEVVASSGSGGEGL